MTLHKQSSGVAHFFSRMDPAGAELRTMSVVNSTDSSFDFYAMSGEAGRLDPTLVENGHRVFHLRMSLRTFPALLRALHVGDYRVVHSNLGVASGLIVAAAYLARVPTRVVQFRSDGVGGEATIGRHLKLAFSKLLIALFATNIIGVSPSSLESGWKRAWQSDRRCRVIPNGVNAQQLRRDAAQALDARPDPQERLVVVNVGRLEASKNRGRAIEIWGSLALGRPSTLLLVGQVNESDRSVMERVRKLLPPTSEIVEAGDTDKVPHYLGSAHVLLTTSLREGLPGVVLEALAVGVPVVSTPLPSVEWIAQTVDCVTTCGLDRPNADWVQLIEESVVSGADGCRKSFDEGIFLLDHVVPQFVSLWRMTPIDRTPKEW